MSYDFTGDIILGYELCTEVSLGKEQFLHYYDIALTDPNVINRGVKKERQSALYVSYL
jgi:hypothetical protein